MILINDLIVLQLNVQSSRVFFPWTWKVLIIVQSHQLFLSLVSFLMSFVHWFPYLWPVRIYIQPLDYRVGTVHFSFTSSSSFVVRWVFELSKSKKKYRFKPNIRLESRWDCNFNRIENSRDLKAFFTPLKRWIVNTNRLVRCFRHCFARASPPNCIQH